VRMDIASGLGSDLFVVSMEKGGEVLNAAITLNGTKPIQVKVKAIPEYEIRVHSVDLNITEVITDIESFDINKTELARDPLGLYKAAIIEAGIIPESLQGNLRDILRKLGGGFEISAEVKNIPAGSGLGVSSILAVALLKALYEVTGRTPDEKELILRVVSLEQRLGSYGGWQDPVGGAFGGIKRIHADPDNPVPSFDVLDISPEVLAELKSRVVLFYAGEPHFSGNILKQMIAKYLLRNKPYYTAMLEAQAIRDQMHEALNSGNIDKLGSLMTSYWHEMIRGIGSEVSNETIDNVLLETADLIEGGKPSGAGGGGFFILVAKKGQTEELKRRLAVIFEKTKGKLYNFDFDSEGITVTKKSIVPATPSLPAPIVPAPQPQARAAPKPVAVSDEERLRDDTAVLLELRKGMRPTNGDTINIIVVKDDDARLKKLQDEDPMAINKMAKKEEKISGDIERKIVHGRNFRIFYVSNIKDAQDIADKPDVKKGDTFAFVETAVSTKESETAAYKDFKKAVFVQEMKIPFNSICSVTPLGFLLYSGEIHDIKKRIADGRAGGAPLTSKQLGSEIENLARIILINKGLKLNPENIDSEVNDLQKFISNLIDATDLKTALLLYSGQLSVWDLPAVSAVEWKEVDRYFEVLRKVYAAA